MRETGRLRARLDPRRPVSSNIGPVLNRISTKGVPWLVLGYDGKVAIVTGAGGGLGREHALELARRGARVVVNDLGGSVHGDGGNEGPAHEVAKEIEELGGEAVADTNSVATVEGGEAIVTSAVDAFGTVDILVNNAGILRDKAFHNMTPDLVDAVLDVHLTGCLQRDPAGVHPYARAGLRPDHQHLVELGDPGQLRPGQLRRRQDGLGRLHPGAGHRGSPGQHQGERHRPGRLHPDDRGASSAPSSGRTIEPKLVTPLVCWLASRGRRRQR